MAEKFYVTTPIYYVNARPHIGHAYTTIVADVLARRHRLLGEDVWFLTGTDEHGQKIERSAAAAGVPPLQFADEVSETFRSLWKRMGITNDQYIRTTDEAHTRGVQKLFSELYAKGQIYLSTYTGQYSIGEEMFVEGPPGTIGPDGKPTETVTEENFFFRLSEYQVRLLDLIESDELRITPESRKNEVLSFLRGNLTGDDKTAKSAAGMDYVPGTLKDLSVSRSSFTWGISVPERAASEAKEKHVIYVWLDALANYITALGYGSEDERQFDRFWPADLHLVGKEIIRFHCVYWPAFLMAAGLKLPKAITAHGWLLFDDAKMSKSKGNVVRTETILDAFGALCPPAEGVPQGLKPTSAEILDGTAEAVPLSKTEAVEDKKRRDLFASDVLRYFLLREIPFGQDGSFSFDSLITRYNSDLANGYGNLVSRALKLISTSYAGLVPQRPDGPFLLTGSADPVGPDTDDVEATYTPVVLGTHDVILNVELHTFRHSRDLWELKQFHHLLNGSRNAIALIDEYFSNYKPWNLAKQKDDVSQAKLAECLNTAWDSLRIITAHLHPFMPFSTSSVWAQLGLGDIEAAAADGELHKLKWGGVKHGMKLGTLGPIFPRADQGLVQIMMDMEAANAKPNAPEGANVSSDTTTRESSEFEVTSLASEAAPALAETVPAFDPAAGPRTASLVEPNPGSLVAGSAAMTTERPGTPGHAEAASGIFGGAATTPTGPADASPQITIDDFAKVEMRVAKVLVCERIPKADKLLRLEVDLGYEKRQILSGIAEWYTPEELIGRRIVVITNLAPRKMRGLESHGMLLAGSADGGKPALATFAESDDLPLGSRLK